MAFSTQVNLKVSFGHQPLSSRFNVSFFYMNHAGMFNDLKTSADLLMIYQRDRCLASDSAKASTAACELDVSVLTSGFWPAVSEPPCILPLSVQRTVEQFETFYLARHSGRRLRWSTLKGSAEIRATFGSSSTARRHELSVSTYQMCVLMLFNDSEKLSFRSIQATLGIIGSSELRRHVISLLNPKCRILEKSRTGAPGSTVAIPGLLDLGDDDILYVNTDFSSKMFKVKVPLISMKSVAIVAPAGASKSGETAVALSGGMDVDGPDVPSQVEETRKHLLEAAIVRTMKTRKTMEHNSLVAEVIKQVSARFHPSPTDVKKRIEGLIDRDYMERDKESKGVYHYLA